MSSILSWLRDCDFLVALALDPDGKILDASRSFNLFLDLEENPVGQPLGSFLFNPQPDLSETLAGADAAGGSRNLVFRSGEDKAVPMEFSVRRDGRITVLLSVTGTNHEEDVVRKMSALNLEMANLTRELTKKNRDLEEANETITRLMNTDPLTGVSNRRYFEETAAKTLAFSRRQGIPLSLVMADIDHFKQFNDRYGHTVGDEVLVAFASMLSHSCRIEDTVVRYGGEEFLVLLPGTTLLQARLIAERLREKTELLSLPGVEEGIRSSFGVTEFLADETLEEFIERVDQALYRAKSRGRNRVEG